MAFIDGTALNVILPSLQRELNATGAELFWVLNSYLLMLAALIILGGSLGDKRGRVRIFKLGILLFVLSSAACGLVATIDQLILFRGIQGIGGALMIPGSLSIISAVFSKEEKGKAIGTWSSITTIVTICGPVLGGALADYGWWRAIFFLNIPIGLFALYGLHYKVPESKEPDGDKIDWLGALLLTLSLGALTFGLLEMPEFGYQHPAVWLGLLLGTILLALFMLHERKTKEPMVPLILFKNRTFSAVNLQSFFLYAGLGGMMLFLSLNLIQIQGYSQLQAGLTFMPFSVLMVIAGRKMGALTDKYGARRFLILGPMLTGIGMLWLSTVGITSGPAAYWTTYFPPFILFAGGMAITVVPLTTAVMGSVSDEKSGIASGINNSVTRISGTFINAILGAAAIFIFSGFVETQLTTIDLLPDQIELVLNNTSQLGEAQAPAQLSKSNQMEVEAIFDDGFIHVYKMVGVFCGILAIVASMIGMALPMGTKKSA